MCNRSQTSASGHEETVFHRLGLFIRQFLHLNKIMNVFGNARPPCYHSDQCLSCILLKMGLMHSCRNQMSSLGGLKGTTTLKMIPLCMVNASFCCSNPFSASEHRFHLPVLIRFIMHWKILDAPSLVLISAWVTLSEIVLIANHTRMLSDSSSSQFV